MRRQQLIRLWTRAGQRFATQAGRDAAPYLRQTAVIALLVIATAALYRLVSVAVVTAALPEPYAGNVKSTIAVWAIGAMTYGAADLMRRR